MTQFKVFIEREARSADKIIKTEGKKNQPFAYKQNYKPVPNNPGFKKSIINNTMVKNGNVHKGNPINSQPIDKFIPSCCLCANERHALYKCIKFNTMNVHDRWKIVKDKNLCENCLRINHSLENCRIGISCKNCQSRHHSLLHIYSVGSLGTVQNQNVSICNTNTTQNIENHVLLSTALIKIKTKNGKLKTVRALLDNASQHSLISKKCAQDLNLQTTSTNHALVGINETSAETSLLLTELEFSSYFSSESFQIKALIVSKVTTPLPNFILHESKWPHIRDLKLADPSFFIENDIDVLLGADIVNTLILGAPIIGPKGAPSALPTKLGYILSGLVDASNTQKKLIVCHTLTNLEQDLKLFWELESVAPNLSNIKDEDDLCDDIFSKYHTRNSKGQYVVKLPFKDKIPNLGNSQNGALKRFYSLEKRLSNDEEFRKQYIEFMREYINLGHMTVIPEHEILNKPNYILPHHGVINLNSSTTKLRVVFDGSFKSDNGNSLNDVLLKGRKLQTDIFNILIKFRLFPIAFSADITKMYRQILIANEDTAYQCIYWRESQNEPLKIYTLNTVTYGTVSAPYLAIKTIKQLCADNKGTFPQAAKIAQDHFYVDDLLAGAETEDSAKALILELQQLMSSGGFELRKWSSSHPNIISHLPENLKATNFTHSFDEDQSQKVLGLYWDLNIDSFQVRAIPNDSISTKRQLLSVIARIFDPLGFVSPSTIILKIIMQDIWKANIDWDSNLPHDIINRWNKFHAQIDYFKEIKISRYIDTLNSSNFEVHGFCDASLKAYAAVIYIRITSDSPKVFLVAAKTRVAPVNSTTLPRLELCGALLLTELLQKVRDSINCPIPNTYLWSDSTITVSWINNPPTKGNQFALHRVNKINSITAKDQWHHIAGKANIADCASRGLYPKQLLENHEWFQGPNWLYKFNPSLLTNNNSLNSSIDNVDQPDSISTNIISVSTQVIELRNCVTIDSSVPSIAKYQHSCPSSILQSCLCVGDKLFYSMCSFVKLFRTIINQYSFKFYFQVAPTTGCHTCKEIVEGAVKDIKHTIRSTDLISARPQHVRSKQPFHSVSGHSVPLFTLDGSTTKCLEYFTSDFISRHSFHSGFGSGKRLSCCHS